MSSEELVMGSGGFWWVLVGSFGFLWVLLSSFEFFWVLVSSFGEGGEALKKKSPLEPIRTY